jgi:hypothetical protein
MLVVDVCSISCRVYLVKSDDDDDDDDVFVKRLVWPAHSPPVCGGRLHKPRVLISSKI